MIRIMENIFVVITAETEIKNKPIEVAVLWEIAVIAGMPWVFVNGDPGLEII